MRYKITNLSDPREEILRIGQIVKIVNVEIGTREQQDKEMEMLTKQYPELVGEVRGIRIREINRDYEILEYYVVPPGKSEGELKNFHLWHCLTGLEPITGE